jgi:hypothetical protein
LGQKFQGERTVTVDPFRDVRDLIRRCDRAALATSLPGDGGAWPYASLVLVAVDHDLSPILLMSDLAEHSKAIAADPRVALLFDGTAGLAQPLTGPRVTVMGRAARTDDPRLKSRFLRHHPDAALYAGFADFARIWWAASARSAGSRRASCWPCRRCASSRRARRALSRI